MNVAEVNTPSFVDFLFGDQAVRVTDRDGNPWFVGADICAVLEIAKPSNAISRLDDDEKGALIVGTPGGPQEMTIINESGLYSLVLTSRKPEAKAFKKWITSEVIPSIRKTGGYSVGPVKIDVRDPGSLAAISAQLIEYTKELEAERLQLQNKVEEIKPKAQALDRISNAEGMMNVTSAAKHLQQQPKKLFAFMSEKRWIYKRAGGKSWLAYQDKIQSGCLIHKTHIEPQADGSERVFERVLVTPKGLAKLAEMLEVNSTAEADQN